MDCDVNFHDPMTFTNIRNFRPIAQRLELYLATVNSEYFYDRVTDWLYEPGQLLLESWSYKIENDMSGTLDLGFRSCSGFGDFGARRDFNWLIDTIMRQVDGPLKQYEPPSPIIFESPNPGAAVWVPERRRWDVVRENGCATNQQT